MAFVISFISLDPWGNFGETRGPSYMIRNEDGETLTRARVLLDNMDEIKLLHRAGLKDEGLGSEKVNQLLLRYGVWRIEQELRMPKG